MNCNEIPKNLKESKWRSVGYGLETLLISHEELLKQECEKLFVTVYAQVCAGYTLEI